MSTILTVENISKQYRLGQIGTGTLSHDLNRAIARVRGKDDPFAKVGEENDRTKVGGDFVWALKDINFNVKEGEVLGIIGKNGAGKSTLLKLLSRITSPTTGKIQYNGRLASLLEVGTGFHPELTGRENIFLNGAILGMQKHEIQSKLDEIIDFSGCAKYVDTPVKRYSSGMKVRLGFAVAAFLEPEILVVDEVLAVGDAEFQKKAVGKMKDVSTNSGRTVLFVSHSMAAVRNLCDRGLVLDNGTVSYEGGVDESISHYLELCAGANPEASLVIEEIDEPIQFNKIEFSQSKSGKVELSTNFEFSDSPVLNIEIQKKAKVDYTYLGVIVEDFKGNMICFFGNDDQEYSEIEHWSNGVHKYQLEFPSHLLIPGTYYLTFTLRSNKKNRPFHKLERALSFTIQDTQTFRGQNSKYRGLTMVAPVSNWKKIS